MGTGVSGRHNDLDWRQPHPLARRQGHHPYENDGTGDLMDWALGLKVSSRWLANRDGWGIDGWVIIGGKRFEDVGCKRASTSSIGHSLIVVVQFNVHRLESSAAVVYNAQQPFTQQWCKIVIRQTSWGLNVREPQGNRETVMSYNEDRI